MKRKLVIILLNIVVAGTVTAGGTNSFEVVMEHYEPIRLALLGDSLAGVNGHGKAIADELRALQADFGSERCGATDEAAAVVQENLAGMIASADSIASAESLKMARNGFYELTKPVVRWREGVIGNPRPAVAYCPMHKRSWLQPNGEIGNPYGGMPRCGEVVSK